ncbi:MFS general substrate transporter [Cylindrobasidium torrendii FP15055 ss-10]|uniref:MFS general substrate transporter n=1 Tax=Cylindrobasidium torrendii FP15055 ss-10 TaxID=1314674 RepID=A0A0D7BL95_9AGAR|nr:MFS general substrate transporter [Cylindrobasidium torrendii FP15055 ss-10]
MPSSEKDTAPPSEKDSALFHQAPATDGPSVVVDTAVGRVIQSKGVVRMEAVSRAAKTNKTTIWAISLSVIVCAWAYSFDTATTSSYQPIVTSIYQEHSAGLATLGIATSIIGAVCKPFIAKFSDITSRPYTYVLVLVLYTMGYIIAAASQSISAYVVGSVFIALGASGIDLLNDIIVGDLTPLEWRGFVSSLLSMPFVINTWWSGKIVEVLATEEKWRWGYGMFAIIMPACLIPAIAVLIYLDKKAQKEGIINIASSNAARRIAREKGVYDPRGADEEVDVPVVSQGWWQAMKEGLVEIDAFGLLLLGFGWSLLLLPFSLKTYAVGKWHNPSMIAMMCVGGVLLFAYVGYEWKYAKFPSAPRRLLANKTFVMCIVIDSFYMISGQLRGLYYSSYVYIGKPWSVANWTYYNNTLTLALCIFGVVAGLIQRWTHRYKTLQIFGLCVKIIGIGILLQGGRASLSDGAMIASPILIGMGGAFSVVSSRVASQASVPHQDMALAISLLALWSKVGSAIGSAIAAVIWSAKMPTLLSEHIPHTPAGQSSGFGSPLYGQTANSTQLKTYFNSIRSIRVYNLDTPVRQGAIAAYRETLYYLLVPALALAFLPLIAACFQTDFYLGKSHNAVTNRATDGTVLGEQERPRGVDAPVADGAKGKLLRFWAGKPKPTTA